MHDNDFRRNMSNYGQPEAPHDQLKVSIEEIVVGPICKDCHRRKTKIEGKGYVCEC